MLIHSRCLIAVHSVEHGDGGTNQHHIGAQRHDLLDRMEQRRQSVRHHLQGQAHPYHRPETRHRCYCE